MATKLDPPALAAALAAVPDWQHDEAAGAIRRSFAFADFPAAFGFMTRVALLAQAADHHPDWSNSYNRVTIILSTHSASGLTAKDVALATAIDGLL